MTVLSLCQSVCDRAGNARVASLYGSASKDARQLLALLYEVGEEMRSGYNWAELEKTHTITLVAAQQAYALPADWLRMANQTAWDDSNYWPLKGPDSAQVWAARESGIAEMAINKEFRIKGIADSQIYLWETPTTGDAGNTITFTYYSKNWLRPADWTASQSVAAGSYRFNDGNIYSTVSGGTCGSTEPTHTSGSASDGGVTWVYTLGPYESVTSDTDNINLPEAVVKAGVLAKWYESNGVSQAAIALQRYDRLLSEHVANLNGAPALSLVDGQVQTTLIPEAGYGS